MKNWTHLHTLLLGAGGGLLLSGQTLWLALVAVLVFAAGILLGRFWLGLAHGFRLLRAKARLAERHSETWGGW